VTIAGAGHFPCVERPEAFAAVLLELIEAVRRAA
jgi:pimeloyl-ACP methyl ester carboxylesterase